MGLRRQALIGYRQRGTAAPLTIRRTNFHAGGCEQFMKVHAIQAGSDRGPGAWPAVTPATILLERLGGLVANEDPEGVIVVVRLAPISTDKNENERFDEQFAD